MTIIKPLLKPLMRQTTGDLWALDGDARCITTNGTLKKDARGVMGRGVARQAKQRYLGLEGRLGKHLVRWGNHVGVLLEASEDCQMPLVCVPVKHQWDDAHASLELIRQSMWELVQLTEARGWETVILPRPGCGNGQLKWEYVEQVIAPILDDRFVVVYQGTGPRWQL
jgi:hypothetical protein